MNLTGLQKKLIAAARTEVLDDRVPYAFEKRVTALLAARVAPDDMTLWVRGLWRAAVSCVTITLLFSAWTFLNPAPATTSDDLSQSFETTLLASVDQGDQAQ
jgi:hypothetical protein